MAVLIDPDRSKLRAVPRLMQILRVLAMHKFLGALFGRGHWPPPKEVRETLEELGVVFLKFGQVLAMRRDLLPAAYTKELELLHDELPAMSIAAVRAKACSSMTSRPPISFRCDKLNASAANAVFPAETSCQAWIVAVVRGAFFFTKL